MKKIKLLLIASIISGITIIPSCKKKDEETKPAQSPAITTPTPTVTPTPTPLPAITTFSELTTSDFVNIWDNGSAVHNGKLWILGGTVAGGVGYGSNRIMSSSDGANWNTITPSGAAFAARYRHAAISFNDKLWVVAGNHVTAGLVNDVWSSSDGITWTQETDSTDFSTRRYHKLLVFNNKIWLIGGSSGSSLTKEIWSSSNGVTWKLVADSLNVLDERIYFDVTVFNNKMWIVGGDNGGASAYANDVWSSTDGISWTQETANAAFAGRANHQVITRGDEMYLIGGEDFNNNILNDVWKTTDGITWTQVSLTTTLTSVAYHKCLVLNDKIYIIGGNDGSVDVGVWESN